MKQYLPSSDLLRNQLTESLEAEVRRSPDRRTGVEAKPRLSWGIVRYQPGRGECVFDGWYSWSAAAKAVYKVWVTEYPGWIVAIVQAKEITFPE